MKIIWIAAFTMVLGDASLAHAQADWCTNRTKADSIRVTLVACPKQEQLTVRRRGDDRALITLDPTSSPAVWVGEALDGSIETNVLCSTLCNFASVCAVGKPSIRKVDGNDSCVANYEFRCEVPGWTLNVSWTPLVTLSYTRHRPVTGLLDQSGELKAPGHICGLADDEVVNLTPNVKTYSFRAIPVSRERLAQERDSWTLGPSNLLEYIELPGGRRARPPTDAEGVFVQQDLRELTLTIEKR